MADNTEDDPFLGIPAFLKRPPAVPKETATYKEPVMARVNVKAVEEDELVEDEFEDLEPVEDEDEEAPAPVKPKAKAKAKPAAKGKVKAKGNGAASKPAKAAAKPAKAKVAKPKAPVDGFGFQVGSLKSKAAAMYASRGGATVGEVKEHLGSNQFNLLTELAKKGSKVKKVAEKQDKGRSVTRYFLSK